MKKLISTIFGSLAISSTCTAGWQFCNPSCPLISVTALEYFSDGTSSFEGGWSQLEAPEATCKTFDDFGPTVIGLQWVVLANGVEIYSPYYSVTQFPASEQFNWILCEGIAPTDPPGVLDPNDPSRIGLGQNGWAGTGGLGRPGAGGGNGAPLGPNGLPCGMPTWRVSEPYVSLWIGDEPLGYQAALGPAISFAMEFGQQELSAGFDTNTFGIGKKWSLSWSSYVELDPYRNIVVHFPSGGTHTYYSGADYLTDTRITGSTNAGYNLTYPDGSTNFYAFIVTNNTGTFLRAFLTKSSNPYGQAIQFNYAAYSPSAPVIRLQNVVDGDGLTNSISYVTSSGYSTNLITQVTDPFGRTITLLYDAAGHLTNITDVAGLSSSFLYDNHWWITNLTTPYGQTSFKLTDTVLPNILPNGRAVEITEPDGGKQLYLFTNGAPGIPTNYPSGQVPSLSPFTGTTLDNTFMNTNNTFHWGKLQYANLSAGFLSSDNVSQLTTNDFLRARMRHWLRTGQYSVSETLSMERAPSPDGTSEGQKTWYDYAGKTNSAYPGSEIMPLFVAQVLPDGTTSFNRTGHNSFGLPTTNITTYTSGSSVALRTNIYTYASNLLDLTSVTNALSVQTASFSYNAFHETLTNYNALGELTSFTYNGNQQLTSITRPSGLVTTNVYSTSGTPNHLVSSVDYGIVGGSTTNYRTNSYAWTNDLILAETDPLGLTVTNTWDNLQRLRRVVFPDGTFTTNAYLNLDLVETIDRMGFSNSFGYDAVRRLVAATNANGAVTRYGYCGCGSLNAITNAFGTAIQAVTSYSWDLQGHLLQTVGPDGYTIAHNYNAIGQETNTTDGLASVTNWHNNQGLISASSNAFGQVGAAIYDVLDRATNVTDANSVAITSTFDNLDRLLTRGYPDAGLEHFVYTSGVRGPTSYTNQLGSNVVNYTYDPRGLKIQESYPTIAANFFTYDPIGDLLTLTDGNGEITTWVYDQYGRTTNKLDAASNLIFAYQYDPNGRLTNRWTPAKGTTSYRFDPVGNITNIVYQVSPPISLAYDVLNRLTNMVDAIGTTRYAYTSAGLLQSEDGPWLDDTVSITYTAQRLRQTASVSAPNASAWGQNYGYDAAERLTSLTSPAGPFGYNYTAAGGAHAPGTLVQNLSLPNSAYITNTYDPVARLLSTALKNSTNGVLNSHIYGYNLAGQRTALTNVAGDYRTFGYDPIGQLRTAIGKEPGGSDRLNEQFGYAYDPAANLSWRTNNSLVEQFTVDNDNGLVTESRTGTLTVGGTTTSPATNVTVNGLSANRYGDSTFALGGFTLANGNNSFTAIAHDSFGRIDTNAVTVYLPTNVSFAYDLNGNLLSDGNRYLAYDDENQLISVTVSNAWRSEFVYDGKMRRRIRREYTWENSAWLQTNEVHYIYDHSLVIQERDANNLPAISYTRGIDLSGSLQSAGGIRGLLARTDHRLLIVTDPSAHAYYHADAGGNIGALVNTSQAIVAQYLYDPYGNACTLRGPLANANVYRFSSKELDLNSGLIYYLYRYYDSSLQRWINKDPLQENGGVNLHSYVANNPANAIDLYGTDETKAATIEGLKLAYEAVEISPAAAWTIGVNNFSGSITVYTSGWSAGNGYVTIAGSVGTFAKFTSTSLSIAGAGYNVYEAWTGEQSWGQAGANIGVLGTAYGLSQSGLMVGGVEAGGPIGFALGIGYGVGTLIQEPVNEGAKESFQLLTDWWYGVNPYRDPTFLHTVPPCE